MGVRTPSLASVLQWPPQTRRSIEFCSKQPLNGLLTLFDWTKAFVHFKPLNGLLPFFWLNKAFVYFNHLYFDWTGPLYTSIIFILMNLSSSSTASALRSAFVITTCTLAACIHPIRFWLCRSFLSHPDHLKDPFSVDSTQGRRYSKFQGSIRQCNLIYYIGSETPRQPWLRFASLQDRYEGNRPWGFFVVHDKKK